MAQLPPASKNVPLRGEMKKALPATLCEGSYGKFRKAAHKP